MRKFIIAIFPLVLSACTFFPGVHKIDVQQGNVVTERMLEQLKVGMSRSQVRYVLGTPLLTDSFNSDRWDYTYRLERAGELQPQQRMTLFFSGDFLERIEDHYPSKPQQ